MSKLPSLREFAAQTRRGPLAVLDSPAGRAAREDLLTYLGSACAGLVPWNLSLWRSQRATILGVKIARETVRHWLLENSEGREMLAFLQEGGPETAAVKKWMAAGRKAWR